MHGSFSTLFDMFVLIFLATILVRLFRSDLVSLVRASDCGSVACAGRAADLPKSL